MPYKQVKFFSITRKENCKKMKQSYSSYQDTNRWLVSILERLCKISWIAKVIAKLLFEISNVQVSLSSKLVFYVFYKLQLKRVT